MRDSKAVAMLVLGFMASACSEGPDATSQTSRETQSVAVSVTAGDLSIVFPLIVPLGLETLDDLAAAKALSTKADEVCATLEMDPSLQSRRPNGTGCPRPEGSVETWGAQ